nr:hypothetical protein [Tanacetum cinerariifolium]
MQEDEPKPAEVQEVVDVVTTSKQITKVVTNDSETITAANAIITFVEEVDEEGDADEHVKEVNVSDAAQGDDSAAHGEVPTVTEEPSIPSPTPPTPPSQPPQDIPSTSQVQQTPPQSPQLKRRVKKLEKRNKVTALKLRRLQRVGTSQRVVTSNDTVMDDESNQGRMIAKMDQDDAVVLKDDKEEDKQVADAVKDVEEVKVDEDEPKPAEVQEVVDVVTTSKQITEVVTNDSETITAANAIITFVEVQVLVLHLLLLL